MRKGLDGLRLPVPRYRPNLSAQSQMESGADATAEDRVRAAAARATLRSRALDGTLPRRSVRKLIQALMRRSVQKRRQYRSLASLVTMRRYRIRVIGQLIKLLAERPDLHATRVDIAPKSWSLTPEQLLDADPRRLLNELRAALYRAGARNADGYLFLYLEAEFASHLRMFRVHVHGIAGGGMIQVIDQLRRQKNYRSTKRELAAVRIRRRPLRAESYLMTYVMKGDWFARWEGVREDGSKFRSGRQRIKEPQGTLFRTWLDNWSVDDLCLRINLTIARGEFKIADRKTYKKGGRS